VNVAELLIGVHFIFLLEFVMIGLTQQRQRLQQESEFGTIISWFILNTFYYFQEKFMSATPSTVTSHAQNFSSFLPPQESEPSTLKITPTGGAVGAVVTGLDVSKPISASVLLWLKRAFAEHLILIFKDQLLSDDDFRRFTTYFGHIFYPPNDVPVLASASSGSTPDIVLVANIEGGYTGSGELSAHSDHHWTPYPSKASFLYALEIPKSGGDTYWSNQYKVYADLDEETRQQIEHLQLITYNPFKREFGSERPLYRTPDIEPVSNAFAHPLVGTHPETGRKFLYLDEATEVEIVDFDPVEGQKLIAKLRAHQKQSHYFYQHRWSVGDIVLWDNYATLHYRPAFNPEERRVLKRISLAGGRPF
jgi:taurine dioxygenase